MPLPVGSPSVSPSMSGAWRDFHALNFFSVQPFNRTIRIALSSLKDTTSYGVLLNVTSERLKSPAIR